MNKKLILEKGTKFGKWKIISEETTKKNNLTHWKCVCECGEEEYIPLNNLMNGSSTQCSSCAAKSGGIKRRKGYKDITGTYWSQLQRNATYWGKFFNIRIEDAWDLYVKQGKLCAYSGKPLIFDGYESTDVNVPLPVLTLIDINGEYSLDNVRWVHKYVHRMKGNLDEEEFILIINDIFKFYNTPDYYKNDDGNIVFTEKFHLKRGYCCESVNGCKHCPY